MRVAAVWSGGKDSCLACFRAIQEDYRVEYLFNLISERDNKVSFHSFNKDMVKIQSKAIGIPIFQEKICSQRDEPEQFERELRELMLKLKNKNIKGLVFGYLLGDYQRILVRRLCSELNIMPIEPLYGRNSRGVVTDFIKLGFKALIVDINLKVLDGSWIGSLVNKDFIEYLKTKPGVDFCGDRGEYHTFVVDGPLFRKAIQIKRVSKININNHYLLNIHRYNLIKK